MLTFTGVLLMFYYHPTKVQAFRDILYLENDVPFGKLLRNMHRWAAHLMIIAVWLHMFRVFLTGSYKRPREFNWCVGVLLMVLTMLLSFTGYLLPDDQLGFWAVTVGTNMARATPGLGNEGPFGSLLGMTPYNDVRFALLGGSIVDANALLRAYIWHCIAIPLIASIFMGVHFWRVRKDGGISGPAPVMLESEIKEEKGPRPVIMRPSGMAVRNLPAPDPSSRKARRNKMLGNWHQLWEIASAPDNVPIVALLFLVPFYIWYAFRQALRQRRADRKARSRSRRREDGAPQDAAVAPEVGARSSHLAVPDAHRVRRRDSGHRAADGLVAHAERAARRAVQSQRDHESGQGAVVFPGLAGDAGLFRSVDGRRGDAHADHRGLDGHSVYRRQSARQRLLHLQAAQIRHLDVLRRLYRLVGGDDRHRHVHTRPWMDVVLADGHLGRGARGVRGEPQPGPDLRHQWRVAART